MASNNKIESNVYTHTQLQAPASPIVAALPPSPIGSEAEDDHDDDNKSYPITSTAKEEEQEIITRPKSESKAEVARLKEEYTKYIEDLLDWCQAQENLDVYQMNAFYAATHELRYYWRNYWKTLCVQFIQTAGLLILLYRDWTDILSTQFSSDGAPLIEEEESRGLCDANGALDLKLLAFFLVSFLSIRLGDQIATIADYGMYGWGEDIKYPHFINWGWVCYGLIVNYITLIMSCFISAQVVYLSSTPLDMILNFVALYFIIELDDEMVTWQNYKDIEDWIKGDENMNNDSKYEIDNDSPYMVWLYNVAVGSEAIEAAGVIDKDDDGYDDNTYLGKCGSKFNQCGMNTMKKMAKIRDPRIARMIMLPLVIALPAYVFICY